MMEIKETTQFFNDAYQELKRATEINGPFNSGHEAYAVIMEELCEFWDEIRLKGHERNRYNMRVELVQIAAMACRASMDLGLEESERKDQLKALKREE
jgi:pyridoxine/pyridoxamine 5'-phosphate oxidase